MSVRRLADQSEQPPSFAFSRVNREWAQQNLVGLACTLKDRTNPPAMAKASATASTG